jgi:hypothetical protein
MPLISTKNVFPRPEPVPGFPTLYVVVMELIKWSMEQLMSVIDTENKRLRELFAQLTQISIDKEN